MVYDVTPMAEWFVHFELCSKAGRRGDGHEVSYAVGRRGHGSLARAIREEQGQYTVAKKRITEKLMPMAFSSLEEFHRRKLLPGADELVASVSTKDNDNIIME